MTIILSKLAITYIYNNMIVPNDIKSYNKVVCINKNGFSKPL